MQAARYKKGNMFHLVEHLSFVDGEPNGIIEVFETEEEALQRVEELNS